MSVVNKRKPVIGFLTDRIEHYKHPAHMVWQTYLEPIIHAVNGVPVLLPTGNSTLLADDFLAVVDGLVFPGSPSNVEPEHYNGQPSAPGTLHDPLRDATSLSLMRRAVELGVPVLAICRGMQEMNVAFGGTLHQSVDEREEAIDHSAGARDMSAPYQEWYSSFHSVELAEGGLLNRQFGRNTTLVNSLHSQGIDRLADCCRAEATAHDGLVEAISIPEAPGFVLGVQWHPEASYAGNALSQTIFSAFGVACLTYQNRRPPC